MLKLTQNHLQATTRWAKNQMEFTVKLNHDESRGCIAIIPKPIVEQLGKPTGIKFVVDGNDISVTAGEK